MGCRQISKPPAAILSPVGDTTPKFGLRPGRVRAPWHVLIDLPMRKTFRLPLRLAETVEGPASVPTALNGQNQDWASTRSRFPARPSFELFRFFAARRQMRPIATPGPMLMAAKTFLPRPQTPSRPPARMGGRQREIAGATKAPNSAAAPENEPLSTAVPRPAALRRTARRSESPEGTAMAGLAPRIFFQPTIRDDNLNEIASATPSARTCSVHTVHRPLEPISTTTKLRAPMCPCQLKIFRQPRPRRPPNQRRRVFRRPEHGAEASDNTRGNRPGSSAAGRTGAA